MLLKQLLQHSRNSPNLVYLDPFSEPGPVQLLKEAIGLANADLGGPRYIVLGVNRGAMEGSGMVGISERAMDDLKAAHRLISAMTKPVLHLAFIYDKIDGKLVGALEIDRCDEPPYVVQRTLAGLLSSGESWVREGNNLRAVGPDELEQIRERAARKQTWEVLVGFDNQPDREVLKLNIPDTSDLPSVREKQSLKKAFQWKRAAKEALGTVNTSFLRLLHMRERGPDTEFDPRGTATLRTVYRGVKHDLTDADNYYLFEEKALKVNLSIYNKGEEFIRGITIELSFPRAPDFSVADRLYPDPDCVRPASEMTSYPEVQCIDDGYVVSASIRDLAPKASVQVFDRALRLIAGPKMSGKKIGVRYTLRARNKKDSCRGRLKLEFRNATPLHYELNLEEEKVEGGNPYETASSAR